MLEQIAISDKLTGSYNTDTKILVVEVQGPYLYIVKVYASDEFASCTCKWGIYNTGDDCRHIRKVRYALDRWARKFYATHS